MKIDLASLLRDCDIEFVETKRHFTLKTCPNCGASHKLNILKSNHIWQCFKCKGIGQEETSKGNIFTFLEKVLYLDKVQIKSILSNNEIISYTQNEIPDQPLLEINKQEEQKIIPNIELPTSFFPLDCTSDSVKRFPEAYQYLINRFVNKEKTIKSFRLRYDAARKRIIFPAYINSDDCVGYQARDITDRWKSNHPKCPNYKCSLGKQYYFSTTSVPDNCPMCHTKIEQSFYPKSINSSNFPKTELFFNQQNIDWNQPVSLVEGPFDAINTPNAIGLLGRYLSDTQFHLLLEKQPELILFLDGDLAGTQMMQELYYKLNIFIGKLSIVFLEDGDDPGSHTIEMNQELINKKLKPIEWFMKKKLFYL